MISEEKEKAERDVFLLNNHKRCGKGGGCKLSLHLNTCKALVLGLLCINQKCILLKYTEELLSLKSTLAVNKRRDLMQVLTIDFTRSP